MSIIFSCKQCGHRLKAPESLAGRKAKCRCGAVVVIPGLEPQELPVEAPLEPAESGEQDAPPEHESAVQAKLSELAETFQVLRPGLLSATRIMAVAVIIAAPMFVGGLYLLRMALAGIMEMTEGAASPARFFLVFAIPAAFFGACFGFSSGRALTNKSGLLGWPAWTVGTAGSMALVACGSIAAEFLFPEGTPQIASFCLFVVAFMSMLGISFYTLWAD